jgi:hypothetical protein
MAASPARDTIIGAARLKKAGTLNTGAGRTSVPT